MAADHIFLPPEVMDDIFHFVHHKKVGTETPFILFDNLVEMHFKTRKWTLGYLTINAKTRWSHVEGQLIRKRKKIFAELFKNNETDNGRRKLPFPKSPLMANVVGFRQIVIHYLDWEVIEFLNNIRALFQFAFTLELTLSIVSIPNWTNFTTLIWNLILNGLSKCIFMTGYDEAESNDVGFNNLRTQISPSILRQCPNLRFVSVDLEILLEFPPADDLGASDGQALCQWLHTARRDGRPKVLKYWLGKTDFSMEHLQEYFLSATTLCNFIIVVRQWKNLDWTPFHLDNAFTSERLALRSCANELWLIHRGPIQRDKQQWAEWEEEALLKETKRFNVLTVALRDKDFGPLTPPPPPPNVEG